MAATELRRKVVWLIGLRAVTGTVLLGSAIGVQVAAPAAIDIDPLFALIGLTYALTVVYALTLPYVDRHRWLVDAQLAGDALLVSAFIFFTGGITSFFASLYVLPIMAAATVQMRRGALLAATLSTVLYAGLILVQYLTPGALATPSSGLPPATPTASVAGYTVVLNVCGFFAVAWLSGSLAERVRSADARLAEASTEIADLQALNQHVIDNLPSGLATTDAWHQVITFNRAAEAITGMPFSGALGRSVDKVLQLPQGLVEQIRDGRVPHRAEYRCRTVDGRDIEVGLTARLLDTGGRRNGLLFTFQDITAVKKAEREVAIQQRLAAVGEMAAGIAHEIRNPLASMSGSIQILREELPLNAEQAQLMDIVLRESERLNVTIRSFLDYARPQRFQIQKFDLRRALNDTALLLRNSAECGDAHQVEVDVPAHALEYEADEGQIKQILWNLATNGLRAMPDGGALRLGAAVDTASDGIVLTVEDHGIGIPASEVEQLFQPFRGSFARGTGLGLAIVHRIVTDYSGQIRISSQEGSGTTVSVLLPARVAVSS